jgi:hypothetical protein
MREGAHHGCGHAAGVLPSGVCREYFEAAMDKACDK